MKYVLATGAILLAFCNSLPAADKEDLSVIRPLLGHGFGNIIEIEGRMKYAEKANSKAWRKQKRMIVHKVGDRKLEQPVMITLETFSFAGILLPDNGTPVRLRGYETGRFGGIPGKAFVDIPQVATTNFHFESVFQVTKLLEAGKAAQE
ncbi:hypothetical protein [Gimesia panareensis]|uniref:Uncharacterized protein n=1 Tax=Gimesia panareensis TaxID=2527978 RepID=A0A517QD13_9PLAN|nr:hypothetical protein [Gimesia panareensis]QDT29485.1 hypothetical protein Enr10x_48400 [Gimesia panareensis]QDU52530.1 hypothetical protein Pan110_49100 [Gimesia panareensis]